MEALPRAEQRELWHFWRWRGERQRLLAEKEKMTQQTAGRR
jgi:hypothetical protein